MKAIESIYAGYVEQTEQKNTPAVEEETKKVEQLLNRLLPANEEQDRLYIQILAMAEESKKQGFIDGFRLAVRMMKECE